MDVLYALRRARQLHADAIAAYDGERTITFAQFADRVTRIANALRDLGVQPGNRVAVLMLNSLRYFELYHAVPLAGAIIVPINIRWNPAEIVFGLSDSGTRLLAVDDYFARVAPALSASLPELQYLFAGNGPGPAGVADYEACLAASAPAALDGPLPDENDVVALFYTSGSTGGPKGVMLTHKNLYANALHGMVALAVTKDWVWLHAAPMFHVADVGAGCDEGLGVAARGSHVSRGGCWRRVLHRDAGRAELLRTGVRSRGVSESHPALQGHSHVCCADHAERHGEPSGARPV